MLDIHHIANGMTKQSAGDPAGAALSTKSALEPHELNAINARRCRKEEGSNA